MRQDPELSALEWQAVAIALNDAARCGCGSMNDLGTMRRRVRGLFQLPAARPLADPRLEAVRNFVCRTHRAGSRAAPSGETLATYGYNRRQIEALALLAA